MPTSPLSPLAAMRADEDIVSESIDLATAAAHDISIEPRSSTSKKTTTREEGSLLSCFGTAQKKKEPRLASVPLNWRPGQGGHRPSEDTRRLLQEAGGREGLLQFTTSFYQKCFADPHIDLLIRSHDDPHGERFANWITEKFGGDPRVGMTPWTEERKTRKVCPFSSHGHTFETPHDRSSAHYAAWHSPKREPHKFGRHFKLDDCRVWMRLHFWAARESGIFERSPAFAEYYIKFIGHFVSVYERTATMFARDSARWSESPRNIEEYRARGNMMTDVIGVPLHEAIRDLPEGEREGQWPYSY